MKRYIIVLTVVLTALISFWGCTKVEDPVGSLTLTANEGTGAIALSIQMPEREMRGLFNNNVAATEPETLYVILHSEIYADIIRSWDLTLETYPENYTLTPVNAGDWTIEVFTKDGNDSLIHYYMSAPVTIEEGVTNTDYAAAGGGAIELSAQYNRITFNFMNIPDTIDSIKIFQYPGGTAPAEAPAVGVADDALIVFGYTPTGTGGYDTVTVSDNYLLSAPEPGVDHDIIVEAITGANLILVGRASFTVVSGNSIVGGIHFDFEAVDAGAAEGSIVIDITVGEIGDDTVSVSNMNVEYANMEMVEVAPATYLFVDKYEVLPGDFNDLMALHTTGFTPRTVEPGEESLPIRDVSIYDAILYCNAKSLHNGLTPVYAFNEADVVWGDPVTANYCDTILGTITITPANSGYRLPTETEWRGAVGSYSTITSFVEAAHVNTADLLPTTRGTLIPSDEGLFDMIGNVREWVLDDVSTHYAMGWSWTSNGMTIATVNTYLPASLGDIPFDMDNFRYITPAKVDPSTGFRCVAPVPAP